MRDYLTLQDFHSVFSWERKNTKIGLLDFYEYKYRNINFVECLTIPNLQLCYLLEIFIQDSMLCILNNLYIFFLCSVVIAQCSVTK